MGLKPLAPNGSQSVTSHLPLQCRLSSVALFAECLEIRSLVVHSVADVVDLVGFAAADAAGEAFLFENSVADLSPVTR